jgi:ergothioneine biosynthesis protein EgtB
MPMQTGSMPAREPADALLTRFRAVRARTEALAAPLSDADASVQSMPDASPAKWHLAHTSWFFETFVLRDRVAGYRAFDDRFAFLFNSYYEAEGARQPRDRRGLLTRPDLATVLAYRAHVDAALAAALPSLDRAARALVELGTHHEEQHQELLLTDILHLFAQNPLAPAYDDGWSEPAAGAATGWIEHPGGIVPVGYGGDGFAFDCEGPAHRVLLAPFRLADGLVTNAEWQAFIDDGGYRTPSLWLSDGWAWVQREGVEAPLYWTRGEAGWTGFTLAGRRPIDPTAPVAHVSYYEADAFAAWTGARLPREAEWEAAARLDPDARGLFDSRWQWTGSAFLPYPGFRAAAGAVGEYNGKFMSGQSVLRGGSSATPPGHSRPSYRNFFHPHQRWQFTGVRLAKDAE